MAGLYPRTYWPTFGGSVGYWRAAQLVTPVVVFPHTYKSVIEHDGNGLLTGYLCTADLLSYEDPIFFLDLGVTTPFPYGFEVIADDVPL